ncbi:MAG TPA: LytTR family transcriptional regulator, partial [Rhodobiaceae bacterium]|nr:LytTR family transcriptional regulator [Rhodobiaceae bacterium]
GLFVEMLRRTIELSQAVTGMDGEDGNESSRKGDLLSPLATLDGFGRLGTPPATATAISVEQFESAERNPRHPPGLYGTAGNPRALNLATPGLELTPVGALSGLAE